MLGDAQSALSEGNYGNDKVRYKSEQWELVLDTYSIPYNQTQRFYTRMRAPFVNKDGLYFKVYPEGFLPRLAKFLVCKISE